MIIQLGCGTIFGPSMGVISHWFKKRRGIAFGLQAVGSSIGGTIFPIATKHLISEVGYVSLSVPNSTAISDVTTSFPWTMRIIGFILILTLGCTNLVSDDRVSHSYSDTNQLHVDETLKRRLPPSKAKGGILNLAEFKNTAYTFWCLSGFVAFLGLYTGMSAPSIEVTEANLFPQF